MCDSFADLSFLEHSPSHQLFQPAEDLVIPETGSCINGAPEGLHSIDNIMDHHVCIINVLITLLEHCSKFIMDILGDDKNS